MSSFVSKRVLSKAVNGMQKKIDGHFCILVAMHTSQWHRKHGCNDPFPTLIV